jgi:hypothetical protein
MRVSFVSFVVTSLYWKVIYSSYKGLWTHVTSSKNEGPLFYITPLPRRDTTSKRAIVEDNSFHSSITQIFKMFECDISVLLNKSNNNYALVAAGKAHLKPLARWRAHRQIYPALQRSFKKSQILIPIFLVESHLFKACPDFFVRRLQKR